MVLSSSIQTRWRLASTLVLLKVGMQGSRQDSRVKVLFKRKKEIQAAFGNIERYRNKIACECALCTSTRWAVAVACVFRSTPSCAYQVCCIVLSSPLELHRFLLVGAFAFATWVLRRGRLFLLWFLLIWDVSRSNKFKKLWCFCWCSNVWASLVCYTRLRLRDVVHTCP